MKLEIKIYHHICALSEFRINNIEANKNDFVSQYDHAPEIAEKYGCGDMKADRIPETEIILKKYNINHKEYIEIADKIIEKISFGYCGNCI